MLIGQEIPDSLKEGVFFTYFSIEYVWYGETFKSSEATLSRYRLISQVHDGVRDLFVEKIDYKSKGIEKVRDTPENAKLTSFWFLNDEDFKGETIPNNPKIPIVVEKWKSFNCLILRVGSSRYLLDFHDLPLRDFKVIDENENIIDVPVDP